MRPSLRFLAIAVIGWAGVRAAALGVLPGAEMFSIERSEAKVPPIVATEFPPIAPVDPAPAFVAGATPYYAGAQASPVQVQPIVYYESAPVSRAAPLTSIAPAPGLNFGSVPSADEWPLSRMAAISRPARHSSVPAQSVPATFSAPNKLDRLQLSSWAMLRGRKGEPFGPSSLGSVGNLGGSQAGARLIYNFDRRIAASLRTSSDIGRPGGEVALGARVQPVPGIPVWVTAERRQKIGRTPSGRNAFALFAEGGVYQRSMPGRFLLDGYLQGGVVGLRRRELFIDGGVTLTRPIYRNYSAGIGVWGGAQPGVYRVDAGPRVTMKVRNNLKVHFDWRQQLAGKAKPGSGPAVTLAGDF
jgi:hypothetical protein